MTDAVKLSNREAWLSRAIEDLRPLLLEHNLTLPSIIRVSVGFPRGARSRIGECWPVTRDKVPQIFISPVLDTPTRVLDVLLHELLHAALPEAGHNRTFAKAAKALGLEGKPTATVAGSDLQTRLEALATTLGPFDHSALTPSSGRSGSKQKTYMLKLMPEGCCDYVVRTTRTHLDTHGHPLCPHGSEMVLS